MFWAAMPEASVPEHRQLETCEGNIGSNQPTFGPNRIVLPEP